MRALRFRALTVVAVFCLQFWLALFGLFATFVYRTVVRFLTWWTLDLLDRYCSIVFFANFDTFRHACFGICSCCGFWVFCLREMFNQIILLFTKEMCISAEMQIAFSELEALNSTSIRLKWTTTPIERFPVNVS